MISDIDIMICKTLPRPVCWWSK